MADWRLAVDIGGTFTDVVLLDSQSGRVVVDKTLTTPAAPLDGVRAGVTQLLAKAQVAPGEITAPIVHATTLITNALIEGRTGRAGLVTTVGFGDTLLIRDEHRYDMYDLQIEFPDPPIPLMAGYPPGNGPGYLTTSSCPASGSAANPPPAIRRNRNSRRARGVGVMSASGTVEPGIGPQHWPTCAVAARRRPVDP